MKKVVIVQARTSSTRLPRKVLKELPFGSGITVLEQVISRLKSCKNIDQIIIATTTLKDDDEIVKLASQSKVSFFRGSLDNVLERYYYAALENNADIIVRITSDCPCLSPEIIDNAIQEHIKTQSDYTATHFTNSYPRGLGVEVFNFNTIEKTYQHATELFEKEHVTPYIYKSHPEQFKIHKIKSSSKLHNPEIRVTLDTSEDYTLLCIVFDYLYKKNKLFTAEELINLFT